MQGTLPLTAQRTQQRKRTSHQPHRKRMVLPPMQPRQTQVSTAQARLRVQRAANRQPRLRSHPSLQCWHSGAPVILMQQTSTLDADIVSAALQVTCGRYQGVSCRSRTFASGEECFTYFHELLTRLTHDQDLNEVLQQLPQ